MTNTILISLVYAAWLGFALRRGMTYLHILQQDDYDYDRFLKWTFRNGATDKKLSLLLLLTGLTWFFLPDLFLLLTFISFGIIIALEKDPRRAAKKKLVLTQRAQRILFITMIIAALSGTWWFVLPLPFLWIINVHLMPLFLAVAVVALQPWENKIQQKFWNEAHEKLLDLKPKVIGITGSFGKTSVKHILGHILKSFAPTLITPGSVNTPMGITRIIREQLEDRHKFFIAEMGAYGPGSIARLCRLVPPDLGIITAIGQAHYERFKTLDTVAEAKFELATAVLQKEGKIVIPDDILSLSYPQKMQRENAGSFIIIGTSPAENHDLQIVHIGQSAEGLQVDIIWRGQPYTLKMPLFGLHHGINAALAFAAAATLGVPEDHIVMALRSVPQITHRLEVKPMADNTTIIDDAFNSNPSGFWAALDVLHLLGQNGRRILITPGMVELGEAHDEEHARLGTHAAQTCDVVIAVAPERIPTFTDNYRSKTDKPLIKVNSFAEASAWLDQNRKAGDVILLENDLPDLYERIPKI